MAKIEHRILMRIGEVALKGLNKRRFIRQLLENVQVRLDQLGPKFTTYSSESRLWIEPADDLAVKPEYMAKALDIACKTFGIVSASPVLKLSKADFEDVKSEVLKVVDHVLEQKTAENSRKTHWTFKVEAKRGDKSFPLTSPEIGRELGAHILRNYPKLSVDVHNPDFYIYIEVRDAFYLYGAIHPGAKGLPIGTGGQATVLLSGGIDSPVASYMMASRGVKLNAVYFHSFPFTSDEAKQKVIDLARILTAYTGPIELHIVNFTDIQVNMRQNCPSDMLTIVMRRVMMQIAEAIARESGAKALVTGESLGQVASQTLEAITTTNTVVDMPVFRPLIGVDKDFTVDIARKIGTYETSILPYEDCCTVFVDKHPKTRPHLQDAIDAEKELDIPAMVKEGIRRRDILLVSQAEVRILKEEDKNDL